MTDVLSFMAKQGFLNPNEVVSINRLSVKFDESAVRIMRSLAVLSSQDIQEFVCTQMGVSKVSEELLEAIDFTYAALVPVDIAVNYCVFAFAETPTHLQVAMEDPFDHRVISALEFFLERRIVSAVATVEQLAMGLQKIYQLPKDSFKFNTIIEGSRGQIATQFMENQRPTFMLIQPATVDLVESNALEPLESIQIEIDLSNTRQTFNGLMLRLQKETHLESAISIVNSELEKDQVGLFLNLDGYIECQTIQGTFGTFPSLDPKLSLATSMILTPLIKRLSKLL